MSYIASSDRYQNMPYNRVGKSGLKLPAISLGLWHNFGESSDFKNATEMCLTAFDLGITHFDLANNYGVPAGSAETNFGKMLKQHLHVYRDELIISSKAGYDMWPGPYGEWGSRKYLMASCDQSLKRLGVDYVDIFYSHRFDPDTPLEETMSALDSIVRQGKALYVGISSYNSKQTQQAANILKTLGTPCLIHQPSYSIFNRWIENDGLLNTLEEQQIGSIVYSPLAQGMLTNKYINGIPKGSRASANGFLKSSDITEARVNQIKALNDIALTREQSLAQMAIAWVLKDKRVNSAIIGASKVSQIVDCVGAIENLKFSEQEIQAINEITR